MMKKIFIVLIFAHIVGYPQLPDTSSYMNKSTIIIGEASLYTVSMTGLYFAWYKNYESSSFHWFNDNNEWLQMDKLGHAYSSYQLANFNSNLFMSTSMSQQKAVLVGSSISLVAMSSIELFDGFSKHWGASYGDLLANLSGVSLFVGQEYLFKEQVIRLKYSYYGSKYADMRPNTLGSNMPEKLLKDYNAHIFWLSGNIRYFIDSDYIPKWLNIAFGYGADGLLGGTSNPDEFTSYTRNRQFYMSFDIDWEKIHTHKKSVKFLFKVLNMIKIPLPTLEYSNKKINLRYI